jgi:microcystin-dependent protein
MAFKRRRIILSRPLCPLKTQVETLIQPNTSVFFSGMVFPYAGQTAPDGFLMCFGQSLPKALYPTLFQVVGYSYGGSGDNFTVPDLRGRAIAGKDDMGGTAASRITNAVSGFVATTLGAAGGSQSHTLTSGEIPAHTHPVTNGDVATASHTHDAGSYVAAMNHNGGVLYGREKAGSYTANLQMTIAGAASAVGQTTGIELVGISATPTGQATVTVGNNVGGGGAHRNVQPTLILNYIIKT